jgi:hypothetical protein
MRMRHKVLILGVALLAAFVVVSNHSGHAQGGRVPGVLWPQLPTRDSGPSPNDAPQFRGRLQDLLAAKAAGAAMPAKNSGAIGLDGTYSLLHRSIKELNAPTTTASALPTWSDSFSYQGLTYIYTMVGSDPKLGSKTTVIPTVIIPLRFVFSDGQVFDASTDLIDGQTPVQGIINSPIFKNYNFVLGGKSVGNTQYGDAFQRANFWDSVSTKAKDYHVLLSQPTVTATQTIIVPDGLGEYTPDFSTGQQMPNVDRAFLASQTAPILSAAGIGPAQLPIMVWGRITAGKASGWHGAQTINGNLQTYIGTSYQSQATLSGIIPDTLPVSHEVIEWLDDPFINNYTPGWNQPFVSNQVQCDSRFASDLLETGDPVETFDEQVVPLYGGPFTYHVTEGMFIDFYTRARRSRSVNGQYSMFNIGAQYGVASAPSTPCTGHIELTDRFLFSLQGSSFSEAYGVNSSETVVGIYVDQNGAQHGWYADTALHALDYPGALETIPSKINDAGVVVGTYVDNGGFAHGFKLQNGQFSSFDFPGALDTTALDINLNGDVVGAYDTAADFQTHGFVLRSGIFSTFDLPFHRTNLVTGINSLGKIVGYSSVQFGASDGHPFLGFLFNGKKTSDFVFPGANETFPHDINNLSAITGTFTNSDQYDSGFVTINGFPYEVYGHVYGVNDSTGIVGSYTIGGKTYLMLGNLPAH